MKVDLNTLSDRCDRRARHELMTNKDEEITPFLPVKKSLFAENNETILLITYLNTLSNKSYSISVVI